MKLKSTRYRPVFKASKGEKIMSALSPYRGVGMIGSWAGVGRLEQVNHLKNWSYVAIHCIARNLARHMPNIARVRYQKVKGVTTKYKDAPLGYFGGSTHTGLEGYGQGYQFVTSGSYYRKALSVIKPHEELEPLEQDHPLVRLLNDPNPVDTSFDLFYELSMFMDCCGVGYLWAVPNGYKKPCELWVIPSHWVWPRGSGGEGIYPDSEHANELIAYYEIRPWGGGRKLIFPPDEVISFPWKNPLSKIDGYSTMSAIAQWIDTEESITKAQWSQFVNEPRPSIHVEMGPEFQDADDDRIARVEAKFMAKYQGEWNTGKPIITSPGTKVTPFGFTPTEMSYNQSEETSRDKILSAFSVPGAAVGLVKDMTFGSILATLAALCSFCLNPRLVMMGQRFTKSLASRFDYDEEEPLRIWWDDTTPPDPSQVNQDLDADMRCLAVTPNEVRAIRGRPAYRHGGDDPMISGPGGMVPLPLNTGEDLKEIAEKVPIIPTVSEHGEEGEAVLADEGELNDTDTSMPDMNPNIEEPNGKPHKELLKEVIKAALKKVSEPPDNRYLETKLDTLGKQITDLKEKKQESEWIKVPDLPLIQKEKPPTEEVIKSWIKDHKPDNHLPPPPPVINVYATIQPAKVEVPPTVVNNEFSPQVNPTPIEVTNHIDVPPSNPAPVEVLNTIEVPASNPTPITVENTVNVSPSDPTPILVKNENIVKVPAQPTREVKTATDEDGKTITIVTERE